MSSTIPPAAGPADTHRPTPLTPVTMVSPVGPASYAWEATDEQVAERYGVELSEVARFDLNTSPTPPDVALRVLREGPLARPICEYPPSDYRPLVMAAAKVYGVGTDEILVGAGADEVLDLIAKAYLGPGSTALVPVPTYAMYRVVSEQRGAIVRPVPRLGADQRHGLDAPAVREAARTAALVWLCSPNNPTGLPEDDGAVASLLAALAEDAAASGHEPPVVVLDEAYAEFTGQTLLALREDYPRLIVVRTASKAYALAGLRVGFAIARRETLAPIEPYRPPGSVSVVSVSVVAEALGDAAALARNVAYLSAERERLAAELTAAGWSIGPSVTNFLLVDFGTAQRAAMAAEELLRRGLVPRTFGARHPLASHLRITVRSRAENDRLICAAGDLAVEMGGDR
jgi:histidinol-phosphate aminotransferase